jgi:hypothetical protein
MGALAGARVRLQVGKQLRAGRYGFVAGGVGMAIVSAAAGSAFDDTLALPVAPAGASGERVVVIELALLRCTAPVPRDGGVT